MQGKGGEEGGDAQKVCRLGCGMGAFCSHFLCKAGALLLMFCPDFCGIDSIQPQSMVVFIRCV